MSLHAEIPQFVDELPQFGFWEMDEALFLVLGMVIGVLSGWMFTGLIVGASLASVFAKYKAGKNRGMLFHVLYWHGLVPIKHHCFTNGLMRFWNS